MKKKKKPSAAFLKEKRTDLIFAGVALLFLVLMISLLIRYVGLRNENLARPEAYGSVMQELNDVKSEKNDLESRLESLRKEIEELNRKISALGGN